MQMEEMVIVSVDDHIVEGPKIFDQHIPLKYKARAPKCIQLDNGAFNWDFNGKPTLNVAVNAVVGRPKEELGFEPNSFEHIRKGCYDPVARLDDMNVNGTFAGVNFPNFPGFALELFQTAEDPDLGLALIKAYNDWHVDEFCATAPDRFIPMITIPLFDVQEAVKEFKRGVAKGARTVNIPAVFHRMKQASRFQFTSRRVRSLVPSTYRWTRPSAPFRRRALCHRWLSSRSGSGRNKSINTRI